MGRRFCSLWFKYLPTDWIIRRQPELARLPLAFYRVVGGRMVITATNENAGQSGVYEGMNVSDGRAIEPGLHAIEEHPAQIETLLSALADWSMHYTPIVAIDDPYGLMLDITGCPHLFGGESAYLKNIVGLLRASGYYVRGAIADTAGTAWAIARYGQRTPIIEAGQAKAAIAELPPVALRIGSETKDTLIKLGIKRIKDLYPIPRSNLQRRFGNELVMRLAQALGEMNEPIRAKKAIEPYEERLVCSEGVSTAEGMAHALDQLLFTLCERLANDGRGARRVVLTCLRLDGETQSIEVGTSQPSGDPEHLFKLFENKITEIEPALGIEVFTLCAPLTDLVQIKQDSILGMQDNAFGAVAALTDRLTNHFDGNAAYTFQPRERHWPERSLVSCSVEAVSPLTWPTGKPRPIKLLKTPQPIEVVSSVPDYPPLMFKYKGVVHRIRKADGPERIEHEWWCKSQEMRDYYRVEDETGCRYWVFRSGHFKPEAKTNWYLHGFFA